MLLIWIISNQDNYFEFLGNYKLLILISLSISILIIIPDILEVLYKHLMAKPLGKYGKKLVKFLYTLIYTQKKILSKLKGKVLNTLLISYICWVLIL